jgi:hypothetical protein
MPLRPRASGLRMTLQKRLNKKQRQDPATELELVAEAGAEVLKERRGVACPGDGLRGPLADAPIDVAGELIVGAAADAVGDGVSAAESRGAFAGMHRVGILIGDAELGGGVGTEAAGEDVESGTGGELPLAGVGDVGEGLASGRSQAPAVADVQGEGKFIAPESWDACQRRIVGDVHYITGIDIRGGGVERRPWSLTKRRSRGE